MEDGYTTEFDWNMDRDVFRWGNPSIQHRCTISTNYNHGTSSMVGNRAKLEQVPINPPQLARLPFLYQVRVCSLVRDGVHREGPGRVRGDAVAVAFLICPFLLTSALSFSCYHLSAVEMPKRKCKTPAAPAAPAARRRPPPAGHHPLPRL